MGKGSSRQSNKPFFHRAQEPELLKTDFVIFPAASIVTRVYRYLILRV